MIKPSALLAPVADAANAAKRVSIDVLHGSALADARRALVRGAKGTGLVKEATTLEKEIDAVEHGARVVEDIEKVLLKERSGLRSMAALLNAATPPRPSRLDRLFALIAERDRIALGLLAERLMKAGEGITLARVNNMAGALREVVAKWLPEVLIEVERAAAALRKKAAWQAVLSPIDSAFHGAVELPTRMKGGERSIKLGTDRLVGMGRVEPQRVLMTWSDGTRDSVDLVGVLDITLAVEVKGRTTAGEGIEQLRQLRQRGRPGYANIGGQLWLLNYEPAKVRHLLVAPAGPQLEAARAAARKLAKTGLNTLVVGIPRDLDDEIIELAKAYLAAAKP